MDEPQPLQVFVRNDKGKVWGPLTPASVELLIDNGIIDGRVQLSLDGTSYVFPGRLPNIRTFVPKALWGDVVVPGDDLEHPLPPPPVPGSIGASAAVAAQAVGPGGLRAGPGAVANAVARTVSASAGPGARAAMDRRFAPNIGTPVAAPVAAAAVSACCARGDSVREHRTGSATCCADRGSFGAPRGGPAGFCSRCGQPMSPAPIASDAIPTSGDLAHTSPLHLYYLYASTDASGLLKLKLPDRTIDIHFRKGNPEHVDSTHADDALASFLVRAQLASYEQLQQAETQKAKFGGELTGALFGLGILNPSTAFTHLASRAVGILFRAFIAESGTFTFEVVDLPPQKAMPLGNRWAVLAEQVRKVPANEIRRRTALVADFPVMKSGGRVAADLLRLTPQEARALSYFDGVHSLAQLAAAHPAEADHFFRVAWMLKDLEAVAFASVKLAAPPPPAPVVAPLVQAEAEPLLDAILDATVDASPATPPAPPPVAAAPAPAATRPPPPVVSAPRAAAVASGPPRPAGSPGGARWPVVSPPNRPPPPTLNAAAGAPARPVASAPAPAARPPPPVMAPVRASAPPAAAASSKPAFAGEFENELKQLSETYAKMKTQNFFEILGVTPNADAGQVKIAYFKMAKMYHPDTVPPGAPEAYVRVKADLFARIGEAQRTLSDDKQRVEYAADVAAGGAGDKVDIAQILASEEMFQKGMIMVKARKFPEAVKMLDEAIKGNGEEGEFYAWRGFAKFFLVPDHKIGVVDAMKDISICLKRNERCAAAWYFQGQMSKLMGDPATAKRHFQKTVQLQPDHVDAQRELRLMK